MDRRKLLKHLRDHGCEQEREGSRHEIWVNPETGDMQPVPRHNEIKAGLARKICRDLSVPPPSEK
jgi:predicted RNA binding protein YcfA (HicA-like mRNA interferase family)